MKKKIPVILCVDTGIDDVVGIALVTKLKDFDIKLIVCDQGNTTIENSTMNTIGVLDLLACSNIPVVRGSQPTTGRFIYQAHGNNGLAGHVFDNFSKQPLNISADEAIYTTAKQNPNCIIIQLGPSTSTASALQKYPDLKKYINRIVVMGGSIYEKLETIKPYTEFNVSSNPEAAEIVLGSGIEILMVPSEMGIIAKLDYYDIYKTKNLNQTGAFIEKLYRGYHHRRLSSGIATCDACAIMATAYPKIFEIKPTYGFVKYFDSVKTGVCLYDYSKKPNMFVCTNIDIKKFKKLYFKILKKSP